MSTSARLIREYLEALDEGPDGLSRARSLLADDLTYEDPMMTVRDADDLIAQIESFGGGQPKTRIEEVVGGEGVGAALTSFDIPEGPALPFAQWFRIEDGRIVSIRVIYDPRPFLAMQEEQG